jgi:hypothetical protein
VRSTLSIVWGTLCVEVNDVSECYNILPYSDDRKDILIFIIFYWSRPNGLENSTRVSYRSKHSLLISFLYLFHVHLYPLNLPLRSTFLTPLLQAFIYVSCGGVRASLIGTSVSIWTIIPVSVDRWWWVWCGKWNENQQGNPSTHCHTVHHKSHMIWPSNPGRGGGNPATNRVTYDTIFLLTLQNFA